MRRHIESLPASYFEERYRQDIDPWGFRTSAYEGEKYDRTLSALTRAHYDRILEVGCSIGVLTVRLAQRGGELLAVDASRTALEAARKDAPPNVAFEECVLPTEFPDGAFDLIVLSEVLYYFSRADLHSVAENCCRVLAPDGEIVLCHWLGETDYPLRGTEASDAFADAVVKRVPARRILRDEVYRLERLSA